ncbi:CHAT domain-containing protein [Lentzea sp. NBRC 102530]|uniref:CHAT domain-containing protein n=1 Tax=Lentzea sp. NBRC 102530 TaxID=3032201 RepID=UPI0024A04282|nr:CHAT domain-containing protein [Lentzea sp. NBRC 102530]GLY47274.1 CHAT domain-containing protein [Lentzea sp. NBRC 102530]
MSPFDDEIEWNRRHAAEGSINAMGDLAMLLRDRYRQAGDVTDLLEGVSLLRQALGYVGDHPIRYPLRINLGSLLLDHFQHFGDVAALREALAACDEAMPVLAEDERVVVAVMRVETLVLLAEHLREESHATEAVASARRLPPDPSTAFGLGKALSALHAFTDDMEALVEAVAVLTESVRLTPPDDTHYLLRLNLLGDVQLRLAEQTGDDSARESAIRHLRVAAADPRAAFSRVNLAAALRHRGEQTGDVAALREGVALLREVVEDGEPGTRSWGNQCENYLNAVLALVELTGDVDLLDQAVEVGHAARGRGSKAATIPLLLGLLHYERFRRTGMELDLVQATTVFSSVADTEPYGDPDHVVALGNLGRVWFAEHRFRGDEESLRRSVTALSNAVRASAPHTTVRAESLLNYGEVVQAQAERTGDLGALAAAGQAFRDAAGIEALRPAKRIAAARSWALTEAVAGRWPRARDAYAFAVGLLPRVVPRRLARADQQRALAELEGLAADAAACAVHAGDPETAVRLLELGRGVLGGQLLQSRVDLSRLRAVAPGLAARVEEAFERLAPSVHVEGVPADDRHDVDVRMEELLGEVRAVPGFADFLAPPELPELLASAVDGPVVLVNVGLFRSDALIVRPDGVTVVELPGVTPDSVGDQAEAFGAALAASRKPGANEVEAQATITAVLAWLWDHVAQPVLTRLGYTAEPAGDWPRVWWSPVGTLALLPIHAAGRFPDGATVLDRVVSSYTPTLRALLHARERLPRHGDDLVVVAVDNAPGTAVLRGVRREADAIRALTSATVLSGEDATAAGVRAALTTHTSAHFACHAASDPDDPSAGHLRLHDGPLSVLDLASLNLSGVRLAVLSACETSLGGPRVADESLHLVSAFQLAGYPQVVGTLWQVNDLVARQVAVDLHQRVAAGEEVAVALHHAVRSCRARFGKTPALWAAHLHSGQ